MKIIVTGGRDYNDKEKIYKILDWFYDHNDGSYS